MQWDTSDHDWLEGRGQESLYLIHMIDDATSKLTARFVRHDSTEENMRLLWFYLEQHGRPAAFYTDKASIFRTAPKTARDAQALARDEREPLPPTQIGRALRELGIVWIAAHSPQAKGRVERSFGTAQDRLVKGLRVARANTLEEANAYLATDFIPWWNRKLAVVAGSAADAHRPLQRLIAAGIAERGGDPASQQRLHDSVRQQDLSDCAGRHPCRFTRSQRESGSSSRRIVGGAFSEPLSGVTECLPRPKVPACARLANRLHHVRKVSG